MLTFSDVELYNPLLPSTTANFVFFIAVVGGNQILEKNSILWLGFFGNMHAEVPECMFCHRVSLSVLGCYMFAATSSSSRTVIIKWPSDHKPGILCFAFGHLLGNEQGNGLHHFLSSHLIWFDLCCKTSLKKSISTFVCVLRPLLAWDLLSFQFLLWKAGNIY